MNLQLHLVRGMCVFGLGFPDEDFL
uniref:Uncharacterized protein n=1 Tax=Rhizophora mucronata TaxID=61149 RepID=A0A2P2NE03_RHIMU